MRFEKHVPKGLTPLVFSFSSTRPADNNGVTEADWERTAAKFGMGVSDTKSSFGGAAYKGPDGDLRICTVIAIRKGFCGKSRGLSEEKRVAFAQKALGGSLQCRWVGFDAGYNRAASRLMGAEEYILNVAADCR
jgi:hypothetical protein